MFNLYTREDARRDWENLLWDICVNTSHYDMSCPDCGIVRKLDAAEEYITCPKCGGAEFIDDFAEKVWRARG